MHAVASCLAEPALAALQAAPAALRKASGRPAPPTWLIPTMQMFISSAEDSACSSATPAAGPSCPGPSASADTLHTLTAVPSMV